MIRNRIPGLLIRSRRLLYRFRSLFFRKNYQRFVVISRSRSGSTLLISYLDSHPNVLAYGERFRRIGNQSCESVWKETFHKAPRQVKWLGFKIFYYHPLDSEDRRVWDYLAADKDIRIIQLIRKNYLRVQVSRELAGQTDEWMIWENPTSSGKKSIKLDLDKCKEHFLRNQKWEQSVALKFPQHRIKRVYYEELNDSPQAEMRKLFDFLDLAYHPIDSGLKRQNPEPLHELVENFSEVKQGLWGTEWEYLLDME